MKDLPLDLLQDLAVAVDQAAMLSVQEPDGTIVVVNDRFCRATGFAREELVGLSYRDMLGQEGEPACAEIAAALRAGHIWRGTLRQRRKDGGPFWTEAVVHPFLAGGRLRRVVTVQRDISRVMQTENALNAALDQLDEVQTLAHVGSWEWDPATDVLNCSRETLRIYGLPETDGMVPFGDVVGRMHPDDRAFVLRAVAAIKADGVARNVEFRIVLDDGTVRNVAVGAKGARRGDGSVAVLSGTTQDITQRLAADRDLKRQALRDPLTGLFNRRVVDLRLEEAIGRADQTGGTVGVLFLDVDGFKDVNDRHGHGAADGLLRQMATRLQQVVRATDVVARVGGDEFVVVLDGLKGPEAAVTVAETLRRRLQEPCDLPGQRSQTASVSIGVAVYPGHGRTADQLVRCADLAMYRVKDAGRNGVRVFEPEWGTRSNRRLALLEALDGALASGEFTVHYQPQVCLTTDRIVSVEALLRWNPPCHGAVSPAEFVPLLEETGAIVPVGRWVLGKACRDVAGWVARGAPVRVAVNVSYAQILHGDLVPALEMALADSGIDPALIELELTESMFGQEIAPVAQALDACRAMGVSIAVDDFGIGYSSLGHLKRFPVNVLKVDKVFTEEIHRKDRDAALVGAMVTLARSLGLRVVAEGIEVAEAVEVCRVLGCDLAQGYFFSRPLPAADVEALLRQDAAAAGAGSAA
ncbi:putative bifunctional diguanylate cyclase/phosphodiesterase [Caenispirillum bisanense]|uniref:putative bifunctional diguanylate cyclase/phosphodiesterase n=1 Tax=Caenispirillum bisanense TaxID=414052 RepID=UPI000BE4676F|nr:bifunctional diguanylate cyclase/phosphodiesterase [Caenispirillum bisanense]